MTDKKDEPTKPTSGAASSGAPSSGTKPGEAKPSDPKRPHATIDLKAIEVKPVQAAKPADAPKADAAASKPASPSSAAPSAASKPTDKPGDKPAAKPTTPMAANAQANSGGLGSAITHMLAGVLGGAMAWYGATALAPQYGTQLGLPVAAADPKIIEATTSRIAALEKSVADRAAATSGDVAAKLAAAQAQIAKLEAAAKAIPDLAAAQTKLAADAKALTDTVTQATTGTDSAGERVAKLEERLKLMSAAAGDPQAGKLPQIAALSGRVVDLEATMAAQLSELRKTVTKELENRLTVTNETSEAAKSGTNRVDRELAAVKSEAASTAQKFATVRADTDRLSSAVQALRDDGNTLKNTIDAVKSDLEAKFKATAKPADVAQAVAPMAGKLSALEQNVQTVVKSEDDRKTNAERIVLALELNNLKRVVDRGQKYAAELADVKKASGGKIDLAVLDAFKDTGIATVADLARDFRDVASRIIDQQSQPTDATVMDRLLSGAKSVIAVRKINYAADDKSAEAVVGRMDIALKDGRAADVIEEAKTLSPAAAKVADDWLARVRARASVDKAIAGLETALKSSLTGAPPAK
jgi:hypothetical protein